MKKMSRTFILLMTAMSFIFFTGCASDSAKKDGSASDTVMEDSSGNYVLDLNGSSDDETAGALQTVYFAFDSSRLSTAARNTLESNARFLTENANVDIQIEGHADERGGEQYNLALGERRARSVRDYLVALGVNANRISIISYGKSSPKAFGHDEIAWSQNRRANFVITAK